MLTETQRKQRQGDTPSAAPDAADSEVRKGNYFLTIINTSIPLRVLCATIGQNLVFLRGFFRE